MTHIAIVGATGLVGTKILETISRKYIPFDELTLFSSHRSSGEPIQFEGKTIIVKELTESLAKENYDYVLMSAGGQTSARFAPLFESSGAVVIDNSSHFRMQEDIDLIVPEVNTPTLNRKIIANPNCSTIQSVVPLKILDEQYGVQRVSYTTYQAVSGSGYQGIEDLNSQTETPKAYPHQIYNNVLPQIDVFLDNDNTKEEQKMIDETKKILSKNIPVSATCVRVPVENSHSVSINVTLTNDVTVEDIRQLFASESRVKLVDAPDESLYPMAITSTDHDEIFVGRIREDESLERTFNIWCTADNLLKGAALNAVQILEQVMDLRGDLR